MAFILEAKNVRRSYRLGSLLVPALRGVSFTVSQGEFLTIFARAMVSGMFGAPAGYGVSHALALVLSNLIQPAQQNRIGQSPEPPQKLSVTLYSHPNGQ